jgi:ABC-2 type transport system ATP-binding protein
VSLKSVVVEDLVRTYGDLTAVDGVSFAVEEGEIFGFLGPNGAGKTTTVSVLCTLLSPTAGRAEVAGHDVVERPDDVRRSIGVVFQETTLDQQLTAAQNLRFHGYAYGLSRSEVRRRVDELIPLLGLENRLDDEVRTYSGGMKRRLEVARGLLHSPRVLFLDEPTLGLDPQTRRRIWEHVRELRARDGVTVFFTTHYMDEAEHSDRIAVIDHGRIVALDTPERLKDRVGGDVVTLEVDDPEAVVRLLRERYELDPKTEDDTVIVSVDGGEAWLPEFLRQVDARVSSIALRRPTLDDVFVELTGRAIREEGRPGEEVTRSWSRAGKGRGRA